MLFRSPTEPSPLPRVPRAPVADLALAQVPALPRGLTPTLLHPHLTRVLDRPVAVVVEYADGGVVDVAVLAVGVLLELPFRQATGQIDQHS